MRALFISAAMGALLASAGVAGAAQSKDLPPKQNVTAGEQFAQADQTPAPAGEAAQEAAVDENPEETTGVVAEVDSEARTIKLEDGQVLTLDETIELEGIEAGKTVHFTMTPDTNTVHSIRVADVAEENDPAAPVEGEAPTIENPAGERGG